jgi:PAP2 superfamily
LILALLLAASPTAVQATSPLMRAQMVAQTFVYGIKNSVQRDRPGSVAASYVAASRLVDNRHFLSDVVFGAALGEAVGWTVVGRHGKPKYSLQPVPVRGGMMMALVRNED